MILKEDLLRPLTLWFALGHHDVRETSTNWGDEIKDFLAAADIHTPAPWCAAFVNYCAEIVAARLGVTSPLEAVKLEAYVQSYVDYARQHGWVVPFKDVGPGDLFTLYYPSLKRNGHIGFVVATAKDGSFLTLEGNTTEEGAREGTMVRSKWRKNNDNTLFLRYA